MVARETEPDSSDYSEEAGPSPALYGKLRTRLRWECNPGVLHLDVSQQAETIRSLECRFKGRINTKKGSVQHRLSVFKTIYTNTPSLAKIAAKDRGLDVEGADKIDTARFLPGGLLSLTVRDWALSPGILFKSPPSAAMATSSPEPSTSFNYVLTLQKMPQVLLRRGAWDSWVTAKARLELDPRSQGATGAGGVRLQLFRKRLTTSQDARFTAGLDWDYSGGGGGGSGGGPRLKQSGYWKFSENNWSVKYQRGATSLLYEF